MTFAGMLTETARRKRSCRIPYFLEGVSPILSASRGYAQDESET
jgi:hypothetical protein